jgi:hypothetical protein
MQKYKKGERIVWKADSMLFTWARLAAKISFGENS